MGAARCLGVSVAILSLLAAAVRAEEGPVVPNAGFEQGENGPTGWSWGAGEGGRGEFTWVSQPTHTGAHAFRVTKVGGTGYTDLTSGVVAVESGRTYEVSAWVYPVVNARRGVYFMVNQLPAGSEREELPNAFGRTDAPFLAGQWQRLTVSVMVRAGIDRLRIHCIQAFGAPDVVWDDFAVAPSAEPPAPRYEPPVAEPLPDLEPARAIVRARPMARAVVEQHDGRPRLMVDGQAVPWCFYVSPFWNPNDAQVRDFRDAGVRVYLVPLVLGRGVYGDRGPWLGENRWDFSEVDDLLWRVLRVDPEGYILFYMGCDPYREWGAEHPDHVTQDQHGVRAIVTMHPKRWGDDPGPEERFGPAAASPLVREEIARTLRELVRHVEQSEPGKAVIGYHVAGFNDGQWFAWDRLDPADLHLADYSPGAVAGFREWLRERYGDDVSRLRQAWNRTEVTFDSAEPPRFERYWRDGFLVDSRTDEDVADWTRFYSEGPARTVDYLAGVLKEATPRPIICGTYYEDITCNSPNHIALAKHLASHGIDYLAGPAAYAIRVPGYPGAVRSVFGSTVLHGKTYLTEQDWRSWHSEPNQPDGNFAWGRAETAEDHNAMVRRECGMMLAFGLGTWWYDMGGGWFRDDGIMSGISEAVRVFRRELDQGNPAPPDLAVFVSEESNAYIAPPKGGYYRYAGVVRQIEELNVSGVPYRLYLQSDLTRTDLPEYRAYLFLNAYALTEEQKRAVRSLRRDGKLLAFVHAPGAVGADDPASAISEVTGIRVRAATGVSGASVDAVSADHPLVEGLAEPISAQAGPGDPVWCPDDPDATVVGRYSGTTEPGAAARDNGSSKSVFVGAPCLSAPFVHSLAKWSGCWTAAEPGDAVYASDRFITIHAIFPGRKVLHLRRPGRVIDLTTGEVLGESLSRIEVDMERGRTRWFALE